MPQNFKQWIAGGIVVAFFGNFFLLPKANAQELYLPTPGERVVLSPAFNPVVLKGLRVDPNNPLQFHFFVDRGDGDLSVIDKDKALKLESSRLIKYFLASLTIPEKDLWVNLSPYEKDRIVPIEFGQTEMGRDLLAQDYVLKQITASLMYPEGKLGKQFWQKIYTKAAQQYGTSVFPVNTFNKVWIVPQKAVVYENNGVAFVLENHLKVMLEEDFFAMQKNSIATDQRQKTIDQELEEKSSNEQAQPARGHVPGAGGGRYVHPHAGYSQRSSPSTLPSDKGLIPKAHSTSSGQALQGNPQTMHQPSRKPLVGKATRDDLKSSLASNVIRDIILPALEIEVNKGKNFAQLRQAFYALILATWYKRKIKDSIFNKVYINQNKIAGVSVAREDKEKIYQQYLMSFKKGVYNYIKEESDVITKKITPRHYFSGGVNAQLISPAMTVVNKAQITQAQRASIGNNLFDIVGQIIISHRQPLSKVREPQNLDQLKSTPTSSAAMTAAQKKAKRGVRQLNEFLNSLPKNGAKENYLKLMAFYINPPDGLKTWQEVEITNKKLISRFVNKFYKDPTDFERFENLAWFLAPPRISPSIKIMINNIMVQLLWKEIVGSFRPKSKEESVFFRIFQYHRELRKQFGQKEMDDNPYEMTFRLLLVLVKGKVNKKTGVNFLECDFRKINESDDFINGDDLSTKFYRSIMKSKSKFNERLKGLKNDPKWKEAVQALGKVLMVSDEAMTANQMFESAGTDTSNVINSFKRVIPACTYMHTMSSAQLTNNVEAAKAPFNQEVKVFFQMHSPEGLTLGAKEPFDAPSLLKHAAAFNGQNLIEISVETTGLTESLANAVLDYVVKVLATYKEEKLGGDYQLTFSMLKKMMLLRAEYLRILWRNLHAEIVKVGMLEKVKEVAKSFEMDLITHSMQKPTEFGELANVKILEQDGDEKKTGRTDLSPAMTVKGIVEKFKGDVLPEIVLSRAQALVTTAKELREQLPGTHLNLENAGEIPEIELVEDPKQKLINNSRKWEHYGEQANRIAYWANQYDVRGEFLKLVCDYQNGKITSLNDFEERLKKIHFVLLLGFNGQLTYKPQTMIMLAPTKSVRDIAGKFKAVSIELSKTTIVYKDFKRIMRYYDSPNAQINRGRFIAELCRFYVNFIGQWQTTGYLFEYGNNSLAMNLVNCFLRLADLKGISHGELHLTAHETGIGLMAERILLTASGQTPKSIPDEQLPPLYYEFLDAINKVNPKTPNAAMAVNLNVKKEQARKTGGIDFNPSQMSMQVKGKEFTFNDKAMTIDAAQVTGATFTIQQMTPVTNLSVILDN